MGATGIAIIIAYVLVMIGVGYWSMKKTKSVGDFFLGGRSIGPWMSAFAYGTTYFSAVLLIGYAGKLGWGFGIHTMWIVIGNAIVGSLLAWWILGSRTRTMTARLNSMTMPDFLSARFNSKPLKMVGALIVFVFLVPYSASVYTGLSYLFGTCFHIPYMYALGFMALLTGVYLIMGGYFALTVTDLIRGIVELFGVTIMVYFLASHVGGFSEATHNLLKPENAPALYNPAKPGAPAGWITLWSLVLLTSFGPWGLPQMVQKFYSIKSKDYIKSAMIVCTLFSLLMAFGGYYTGALTHLYAPKDPAMMEVLKTNNIDNLMPTFLSNHTPASISIVIILLVFSASMSSLSSLVLVSSSAIAMDLYAGIIRPKASKETTMLLMRVLCAVFVAVSLYIALRRPLFIVDLMALAWGALAGSFAAPYIYGLFWRRTTAAGASAGMLTGLLITVGFYMLKGQPWIAPAGALAIVVPFIVVPVVSLMTQPPSKEIVSKAFSDGKA
ncbi:MAG: sodium/solute symporter [Armatimonadota bacterium]|nr:sodium/solute symporter [bacterium]